MTGTTFYSVEKSTAGGSGGTTQAESRVYNERLVLSLIRRHRALSKSELTKLTGLAPQTMTTIVNRLAESCLVLRGQPLRGRMGQPSVPHSLNPDGAYSLGLKVDYRSADVVMVDFLGKPIEFDQTSLANPTPRAVVEFTKSAIGKMIRKHKSIAAGKIAGLGIASPFYQWNWGEEIGISETSLEAWRQIDIRAELDREFDWPVYLYNDATVSAGAELMFGAGIELSDFLYIYLGYIIGGGLVLDHHLFSGRNNLAASVGQIPVPAPRGSNAKSIPLFEVSSIHSLVRMKGGDDGLLSVPEEWNLSDPVLIEWMSQAVDGISHAIQSAVALVDVDKVVLDGALPALVRKEIGKALRRKLARHFNSRPEPLAVLEGSYGYQAPAIGGASIPLLVNFSNDKGLLFKV